MSDRGEPVPTGGRESDREVDRRYAEAYDRHPIDEPDDWGDLTSFRVAASVTTSGG